MGWLRLASCQVFLILVLALLVDRFFFLDSLGFADSKWLGLVFYVLLGLGFLGLFLCWKLYTDFSGVLLSVFSWMSLFLLAFVYVQYRKQAFPGSSFSNPAKIQKDSKSLWYGQVLSYPIVRERRHRLIDCKKEPLKKVKLRQEYWVEWHGFIEYKDKDKDKEEEYEVRKVVLVKSSRILKGLKRGDWIVSDARIESAWTFESCPGFDYSRYLRDLGIDWISYPFWNSRLEILSSENSSSLKQTIGQVHYFLLGLYSRVLPKEEESQLISGLLLGRRAELPESVLFLFQQVGVSHILAISGLHVGLIAGSLFIFLSLFALPKRWILLIISLFLVLYIDLVGSKASILRAVIMFLSGALVFLLDRSRNWWNALFLAGSVILLIHPFSLFQLSFQLSFLATLGIFLYYEPTLGFCYRVLRFIGIKPPEKQKLEKFQSFPEKDKKIQRILIQKMHKGMHTGVHTLLNLFLGLFSVSFASQVLTAPLLIYTFGGYSWISLFSNLFIVILAEFAVALGLFLVLLSFSPFFLEVYGTSLSLSLKGILKGSEWLYENLGGYLHFDLPLWIFYLYYLTCVLIFTLKNVEGKLEFKKGKKL